MSSSAKTRSVSALPEPVRRLIQVHLRSAAEIELLLLLFRSPETYWSAEAAANVVGADEREIRAHFGSLADEGLLERGRHTDAFRFAPMEAEAHAAVATLAELYAERREDVTRFFQGEEQGRASGSTR